jgi:hypothetical protein
MPPEMSLAAPTSSHLAFVTAPNAFLRKQTSPPVGLALRLRAKLGNPFGVDMCRLNIAIQQGNRQQVAA